MKTECSLSGVVSLPTKIKRFCVLRSPHVDKDSREHFEIRIYKRFIDINTDSPSILDLLLKTELPSGVSCSLKVLQNA
jgi:small subunit ribosomal protein S10